MNIIWKKTIKALLIIFILLFIFSFIINIFYYNDILDNNTIKYFKLIFSIITFFIGGLYMGKNSPNKGYLYGLRLSILTVIILMIMGIILRNMSVSRIIYYLVVNLMKES